MVRRVAVATAVVVASSGMLFHTPPANATFPGENGRIAYSTDTKPSQIYTVRPDGTGLQQLTHVRTGKGATSPAWSADGTRIAFVNDKHIWVMNADGSGKTELTNADGFRDRRPSWSPDGTRIIFSHCDVSLGFRAYCDLDVIDANGTNETMLLGGNWSYDWPRYSPDGSKIAFVGDRDGYVCAIWVANADGSEPVRLTDPAMQATVPDWSPDGTKIAFTSNCKLPGNKLWIMNADGTDQHELISEAGDWSNARFAPDGLTIAARVHYDRPDHSDIYFVDIDGTGYHEITTPQTEAFSLDWAAKRVAPER